LINVKVEERFNEHNTRMELKEKSEEYQQPFDECEPVNEYENALRHLEAEIRNHIRVLENYKVR
jgi:hypothetical protein